MNTRMRRGCQLLAGFAASLILAACAVTDGGYDSGDGPGYGNYYVGGYIEPYGYDYGAWGHGYHVAPGRGGDRGHDRANTAYRPAPSGHRSPSIPARPRRR